MNIAATALGLIFDASQGGSASAGPVAGGLLNIASTVLGGDGAGSNPIGDLTRELAGGSISSLLGGALGGSIAGFLA